MSVVLLLHAFPLDARMWDAQVPLLERAGYEVHLATNGREAITTFRRVAPALVLMDVQMPDMDGFEATATIRERERGIAKIDAEIDGGAR